MKTWNNYIIYLLFFISSMDSFGQGAKSFFMDKNGFFFYVGVNVPNKSVNLVWDEFQNQPTVTYILEKSTDGKTFNQVLSLNDANKPEDIRAMSVAEQENVPILNGLIYSTETGNGRFVYNELIPDDLLNANKILDKVIADKVDYEDVKFLKSALDNIYKAKQLIYRIKFIYPDGSIKYSGTRSLADYLYFILKKGIIKTKNSGVSQKIPTTIWTTISNKTLLSDVNPPSPLAACPPIDVLPACLSSTGNSKLNDGTCCNYTQTEYLIEQAGGAPCTKDNKGLGICSPSILDCGSNQPSSDPCCAGGGCTHYAVCTCKPWECCTYAQAPVWYVTASNNLTPPTADFTPKNICLGEVSTFTSGASASGNSGPIIIYAWDFGDGNTSASQNPIHTYTAIGTYSVSLSVTTGNACSATIIKTLVVNPIPVANFSVTTVCFGNNTQFINQSTNGATSWNWDFGDNNSSSLQDPSHTYSASGTYTAILTSTGAGGCNSAIPHIVTVNPQPIANFSATTACLGDTTHFTDQTVGGGTIWEWDFGDSAFSSLQNPSHVYKNAGTYTVTMKASAVGNCNSSYTRVVTVNPQPMANFSSTPVCFGLTTQFIDLSTGGGTQWSWSFGDGNTSTQQNPSNTYSMAGTYTAILTSTGIGGCTSIIEKPVIVYAQPIAKFNIADMCINANPAVFTDQSVSSMQWTWNFGDGSPTSSLQNPTHIYGAPGTYSITLYVLGGGTCNDSVTHAINVNPIPDASFTSNVVCFNNPTQFTDHSLGIPIKWHWDFGDGNTDSSQSPGYTYGTAGTFTVTLVITNSLGCTDTLPRTAIVQPLPAVKFDAPTVCIGSSTCFFDSTTIASGALSSWSWNFGDPNSGTSNISHLRNPCHLYNSVGNYNVFLTVTSNNNCQSITSQSVSVTIPPVASFSASNECMNLPTTFTNTSIGSIKWIWNFGDGDTSMAKNPTHVYLGYGKYVVTMVASAGGICTDTISDTITVNPTPIVNFKSDSVCIGKTTIFTDESFIPTGNISTWYWDFNDPASGINNTSDIQNPTHVFSAQGTYSVTLTTTSSTGCVSSKTISTPVLPGPEANFYFSPGSPINLTDDVVFADISKGNPIKWWWDFGDKDTSVLKNPTHYFDDMGTYTVTLIVVNKYGCIDTIHKPLDVQAFTFYIPNAFTPNGDGKNDSFFGKGIGITDYQMQIYDRWGNLIFYCNVHDLPQSVPCRWDGKMMTGKSDKISQEDEYVWKVKLTDIYGKTHAYMGKVLLTH